MNKGGRPTKLNDEVQAKIVNSVRQGNYLETASAYAGINKSTLHDWLRRGEREKQRVEKDPRNRVRKAEQPFVTFSDLVEKALAEAEVNDVNVINEATRTDWKASAWRLERKFPERWGYKTENKTEITGKDGGAIEINDARAKLIEKLTKE